MSATVWLVRHGYKEKWFGDVPLTSEGVRQARATARFLSGRPVAAIVSSPLRRTVETAECLAERIGIPVQQDARLRERANWGDIPGQSFEAFIEVWERCTLDADYEPPGGGDSVRRAASRLQAALSDWTSRFEPGDELVFVTHGGLITDFLVCAFEEKDLNLAHPDFVAMQSRLIPECSVTELTVRDDGTCRLGRFADIRHLE
ncbi:hypothetical protein CDO73_09405 [Saccharibacillus sp. O23]|uniref:histidine phosphatase family protein n=1 Tax=Saccharibacillus sp. O23 TaxID=2009338 RepID=UPI000B4E3756|nr:histidine phosphatase family protein [Saccharibacillus sp. O23]OWR30797.1 hypothetical protein CDO73_09405 [Saccharibacillus sp. O23]